MTFSTPLIVLSVLAGAIVVLTLLIGYKLTWPSSLSPKKPFVSWFPKYRIGVSMPSGILENREPELALAYRLERLGFQQSHRDIDYLRFSRGSVMGDFHIEISKVDLTFRLPVDVQTILTVEYGAFAAFDTGDLWQFTAELQKRIETDDFPQVPDFADGD